MLSSEILVNALAFTRRPSLETFFGFEKGFKSCPERSSHFPELLRKTALTTNQTSEISTI
jgi:hypothetical protein